MLNIKKISQRAEDQARPRDVREAAVERKELITNEIGLILNELIKTKVSLFQD